MTWLPYVLYAVAGVAVTVVNLRSGRERMDWARHIGGEERR